MKRKMNRKLLAVLIVIVVVLAACTAMVLIYVSDNTRDKSNLFAYAIDLENENWTYAPMGLDYGMTAEEVIIVDEIKTYTWEKQDEILRTEQTIKEPFGQIKEYEFVKRYI